MTDELQWWLDESSLPDVCWARLLVFPDGASEVMHADGHKTRFRSRDDAVNSLLEEEFVRPTALEKEDLAKLGLRERDIEPPAAASDVALLASMSVRLDCSDLLRDLGAVDWREPWSRLSPVERDALDAELQRELRDGHVLYSRPARAYLRRIDRDDVLFVVSRPAQLAIVHLTYTSSPPEQPPWPTSETYEQVWAFVDKTLRDAADYEAG
jgi:hypothetical protein